MKYNEIGVMTVLVMILCGILCFAKPDPEAAKIISMAITGLFGVITGRATA